MRESALKRIRSGSFVLTATGLTTSPTGVAKYARVGDLVTMSLPAITGVSNAVTCTLTGLPRQLWPSATRRMFGARYDNGTLAVFPIEISTAGVITLYSSMTASNTFTNSGTKGVGQQELAYLK